MKHELLPLDDLPPGEMRGVDVGGVSVCVVRTPAGDVHAVRDVCGHMGAKLSNGYFLQTIVGPKVREYALADGEFVVRCPWHGYEYDVKSGQCLADTSRARVRVFTVVVEDGKIYIER